MYELVTCFNFDFHIFSGHYDMNVDLSAARDVGFAASCLLPTDDKSLRRKKIILIRTDFYQTWKMTY